jgi:hypothetical protein
MKHFILVSACVLSAPVLGQSYLERTQKLFDEGKMFSLGDIKSSQVWEGRCINSRKPDDFFSPSQPVALLAFDVKGDSVVGYQKRFEFGVADSDSAAASFLSIFRNTLSKRPSLFETAYENSDWGSAIQRVGFLDFNNTSYYLLRRATTTYGDSLILKSVCADADGCQFFSTTEPKSLSYRENGETWGYCYFTAKAYDESSYDPNVPPPPPPPPQANTVSFSR